MTEHKLATEIDWVTNIPSPYRNHLFETMVDVFPRFGLDLYVRFMAWSHYGRHWRFGPQDLRFPHRVHSGVHPHIAGLDLYTNPGLLFQLARKPRPIVVVCGYSSPTHAIAPILVGHRSLRVLYCESHLGSELRANRFTRAVKKALISRFDAFIVPGELQRQFLIEIAPEVRDRTFWLLPNLIDEEVFVRAVADARHRRNELRDWYGVREDQQLWICPARLEPFKGVDRLLDALEGVNRVELRIAGDGSQRASLARRIADRNLHAKLLGAVPEAEMVRLYAAADVFILPSLQDPSPLSPIEACAAGLPLALSRAIGNLTDVTNGANGWVFDPRDAASFSSTLEEIARSSPAQRVRMGNSSAALYRERFDSVSHVAELARGLRALADSRSTSASATA